MKAMLLSHLASLLKKNIDDQMSQRSQVSRLTLCRSKVKVLSVSESVSERQGHLVSCFGQLKIMILVSMENS